MEAEKILRILRDAGLAGNEAKVYAALLELGSVTAGEIAKASGVNRTNVYDAIRTLSDKGLVSYIKKTERRYFEAASPNKFLDYLEDKEDEVRARRKMLEAAVPELEMKRTLSKERQEATVYTGRKGLKTFTEDVLRRGEELMVFGAEGRFTQMFKVYSRNWNRRRARARIRMRIIYGEKLRETKTKESIPFADIRFNSMFYETPSTTWIYGDNVAIVVWSEHVITTLIRSAEVAKSYRQFFGALWKVSDGIRT